MEKLGDILETSGTERGTTEITTDETELEVDIESDAEKQRKQLEAELSAMNIYSLDHTFASFNQKVRGVSDAYRAFKALAEGKTDKPFLLCCGGVGNGKTHLCEAFVIEMRKRKFICRYNKVVEILRIFKSAMGDNTGMPPVDTLIARFAEARILILDDYGIEYGSRWEQSVIEDLIDERYRARRITVLCTNLDISELPERIASRFSDPGVSVKVLNEAGDYRKRRRKV